MYYEADLPDNTIDEEAGDVTNVSNTYNNMLNVTNQQSVTNTNINNVTNISMEGVDLLKNELQEMREQRIMDHDLYQEMLANNPDLDENDKKQ